MVQRREGTSDSVTIWKIFRAIKAVNEIFLNDILPFSLMIFYLSLVKVLLAEKPHMVKQMKCKEKISRILSGKAYSWLWVNNKSRLSISGCLTRWQGVFWRWNRRAWNQMPIFCMRFDKCRSMFNKFHNSVLNIILMDN